MEIVGLDFGTTNSLISYITGSRPINLLDTEGLPFPSVISYEGEKKIIGRSAKDRIGEAGLGIHGNIIRSPKFLLGKQGIYIEGVERNPIDIVADLVEYIKNQSLKSPRGTDINNINKAIVTIPVDMQGRQRKDLRDAFLKAGINIVQFLHEPLAALYGYIKTYENSSQFVRLFDNKYILVFDWGGGTLDLTLCKLINGKIYQIINDGTDEVGGDIFDETLKNELIKRYLNNNPINHDNGYFKESLNRLLHRCERGKIDLSTRNSVEIYVGNFFNNSIDSEFEYTLNRFEMEEIFESLLEKGLNRIESLLESVDISSSQISLCLVTGGMANIPSIQKRLHEWFGPERVYITDRSNTLVAEGAAWVANDGIKLHLAKNIELLMARNNYIPLIQAGTEMPMEGEEKIENFSFYCVDPRDGYAKFQLQTPVTPSPKILPNDPRISLESFVIKVDKDAMPFRERLKLVVKIDDNLILYTEALSTNIYDKAFSELHNLEFSLSISNDLSNDFDYFDDNVFAKNNFHEPGSITIRSNISNSINNYYIPGELLKEINSNAMDVRSNPPQIQIEECLYYQPCSICRRSYNDPNCICASKIT